MNCTLRTALLVIGLASTDAAAGEIRITMTGFANDDGMARIILMEGVEGYTSVKPVTLTASVPISDGQAIWQGNAPAGTYAVIAHHDQNANDELDRPFFQLPLEPYGYSNGAWTSAGLPTFDEVAFEVGDGTAHQRVHVRTNAFVTLTQIVSASAAAFAALFAFVTIRGRRTAQFA